MTHQNMFRKLFYILTIIVAGVMIGCSSNDDASTTPTEGQLSLGKYNVTVQSAQMDNYYTLSVFGPSVDNNGKDHFMYFYLNTEEGDYEEGENLAKRNGFYMTCTEAVTQSVGGALIAGYRYHYVSGDAILVKKYSRQPHSVDSVRVKFNNLKMDYDKLTPDDTDFSYYIPDDNGKVKTALFFGDGTYKENVYECHVPKQLNINGEVTF